MPNWSEILSEVQCDGSPNALDKIRRKYLAKVSEISGRNTIAYYSGFLQKPGIEQTAINDNDKNGLMAAIHGMKRDKGLDLILHTPGGDIAATESIVDYLKQLFGNNVRAIVPQLAMSAGTMLACSCKSIIMGKESNLGPIDPQFRGVSAYGIVEEFSRAREDIAKSQNAIPVWHPILQQYRPTFIGECEKAIEWSKDMVEHWLAENMLSEEKDPDSASKKIVEYLSSHQDRKTHSRHIGVDECQRIGLKIERLEDFSKELDFQDAVLSVHHAYMLTFSNSPAVKIVENQSGVAMINNVQFNVPKNVPTALLMDVENPASAR